MTAQQGLRVMTALARLLVRVFFRRIDLEGADRLPADRPVVLLANHANGLVDGLVLIAVLPRYPRFLGKATLFKILPLVPFLRLAGVVPVHRTTDEPAPGPDREGGPGACGRDSSRNDSAFRTSRALLAARGVVALFPEGISHDEARVQGLRTGAARIALGAAFDDGVAGVVTVPVGLIYDDKARFRSRALVRIGAAASLDHWAEAYQQDPTATVRSVTDSLARQLATVAPMYDSRQDELSYRRVASLLATDPAERDDLARALGRVAAGGLESAARVDVLTAAADRYGEDLALVGVTDAHIARELSADWYRRRLRRAVAVAAATAPLAAVGAAIHFLPYQVMKQVGKRPANEGMRATVKLLGCVALFTTVYTAIGIRVGRRRGLTTGLAAFALAPLSGYVTVRWTERMQRLGGMARARTIVATRRPLVADLADQRAEVVARASDLLDDAVVLGGAATDPTGLRGAPLLDREAAGSRLVRDAR